MDFYTNVCRTRDKILVTGYQGNKKQKLTVSYRPKHFVQSKKGDTAYRSLDGRTLEIVELNSMGGARKFRNSMQEHKDLIFMDMTDISILILQTSGQQKLNGITPK